MCLSLSKLSGYATFIMMLMHLGSVMLPFCVPVQHLTSFEGLTAVRRGAQRALIRVSHGVSWSHLAHLLLLYRHGARHGHMESVRAGFVSLGTSLERICGVSAK